MRYPNHGWRSIGGAAATLALSAGWCVNCTAAAAEIAAAPPADAVSGVWQHHKVTFAYMSFTTLYTCSGLEDQVRRILLHLGARTDAAVRATGCPGADNTPSRNAWVDADFYSLAPAADEAASDAVKARWTSLEITPRRPSFMGDGDCELVNGMKDIIIKNFSLRAVDYRTSCAPYVLWPGGFSVKGQTLRAVLPASSAVKG